MKIHIYYRHASNCIVKNRPSWFSFEKCWVNFLKTIEGKDNINLTLALDGNIEDDDLPCQECGCDDYFELSVKKLDKKIYYNACDGLIDKKS